MHKTIIDVSHWQSEKTFDFILKANDPGSTIIAVKAGDLDGETLEIGKDIHLKDFVEKSAVIKRFNASNSDRYPEMVPYFFISLDDINCGARTVDSINARLLKLKEQGSITTPNMVVIDIETYDGRPSLFSKNVTAFMLSVNSKFDIGGVTVIWYMPKSWYEQINKWCYKHSKNDNLSENIANFRNSMKWVVYYPSSPNGDIIKNNFYKIFQQDASVIVWQYTCKAFIPGDSHVCDTSIMKPDVYNKFVP